MAVKYKLKLFVAGVGPDEEAQITKFKEMMRSVFNDHSLEVIDVLEKPELAEAAKILATPTVIRSEPKPPEKFLIDLEDTDKMSKRLERMKE